MSSPLETLTHNLSRLATHYDMLGEWPAISLEHLTQAGAWTWILPQKYGGLHLDPASQLTAYEAVAAGCMSCALILTQRDGACEFIASSTHEAAKEDLLPRLARHELMASIGISQLTTSRQGRRPVLTAAADGVTFRLNGFMPWVTGARKCDLVVTGAAVEGGGQILAYVPLDLPGVQVDPPMKLAALECALTSEIHCKDVVLGPEYILRGPEEDALKRRSPVKSLVVSACGMGLARSLATDIAQHVEGAGDGLRDLAGEMMNRYAAVRERLFSHASRLDDEAAEIPKNELRVAVNDLLLKLAMTAMTLAKGSGFIRQRDTQRLVREAMFFLVWSAPEVVRYDTLTALLAAPPPESKSMPT